MSYWGDYRKDEIREAILEFLRNGGKMSEVIDVVREVAEEQEDGDI